MRKLRFPFGFAFGFAFGFPVAAVSGAFILLSARPAPAQNVASSFDELRQLLKKGQHIVLTDTSGRRIKGAVAAVGASSLDLLTAGETRTFAESSVMEIEGTDSKWNGALLGAGIGTGFAMWDYLIDPSEPGNGAVFTAAIGMGLAIGAGIDALLTRGLLFSAPQRTRTWNISPIAERRKQGVMVSLRLGR